MKHYLENKVTHNQISFCLTDKPMIDEREIHSHHEILLYIGGDTQLLTKDGKRHLKNNSIIIIPKETYHFFRLGNSEKFTRLKISFTSSTAENMPLCSIMSKMKVFEDLSENISYIFSRLCEILKNPTDKAGFYAYSAFLLLITELDIFGEENNSYCAENSRLMSALMEYISENLTENLNIKALSEKFFVSSSSITHTFKKEFGISLHKYITQKRLIQAKRLINEGKKLSGIYADVGFMDYSSFYKAYIRFFGRPPSKDKENAY